LGQTDVTEGLCQQYCAQRGRGNVAQHTLNHTLQRDG